MLIGTGARLFEPDRMLYWHDEVYTLLRVFGHTQIEVGQTLFSGRQSSPEEYLRLQRPDPGKSWGDTLTSLVRHPEQGPLYYLLARAAADFASVPQAGPRLLSAVIGLFLAPAVFWLMRELWGPGRAPWIAAALVSVSPLHLLYAQEARPYALWTVLIVAASAALARALRRDRGRNWLAYAGLLTLGLYTHLLFLLLIPIHGLYTILARRTWPPRRWLAAGIVAGLLFLPWVAVLWLNAEMVGRYLSWMERPLSTAEIFGAWGRHLIRVFLDPGAPPPGAWLGLLPLGAALVQFCRKAPGPGRWLLCLIGAAWVAVVLGPDLIGGGSRSGHARYALPSLLVVELALAWVLAAAWEKGGPGRGAAVTALALLLALGGWSQWRILQADTWWNKNFSATNKAVAQRVNASAHALLLVSDHGVGPGELVSVVHELRPDVAILGESEWDDPLPLARFDGLFALTPSPRLRELLGDAYRFEPLLGTWQWFQILPAAEATR